MFALVLVGRWLNATKIGGQQPAEPFRIAGNFYYVGANDVAAFLITGPEGHIVLDGGYPSTAPMIMDVNAGAVAATFAKRSVSTLIHGHTHRPAIHSLEVAGRPVTRIVLGDWYTQGSVLEWTRNGYELRTLPRR